MKKKVEVKSKGLKDKDVERLIVLQQTFPGELSEKDQAEKQKLEDRLEKFGKFNK